MTFTLSPETSTLVNRVVGDDAPAWLLEPAVGLNRQRPIDLLSTEAGVQLVQDFLGRLEHGVYT